MKFSVIVKRDNRIKLSLNKKYFTEDESLKLIDYVRSITGVSNAKHYSYIGELSIYFYDKKYIKTTLEILKNFSSEDFDRYQPSTENVKKMKELILVKKKIARAILFRYFAKYFLPMPLGMLRIIYRASHYVREALRAVKRRKLEVSILDATAIVTSLLRRDFSTAGSVMFLLQIGELLEDFTHKRAVAELSRSLAINVETVWRIEDEAEVEVPFTSVVPGDKLVIRVGNMIPFDGKVFSGIAMVNQSALTGESVPVEKSAGKVVYAGTVVEDGEIIINVERGSGSSRIDEIIKLIEESEKNQSQAQIRAYSMSDKLVKYSFAGFGITYALTRNLNKALSFLMVDYSCAIKICTPIAMMSAMKQCSDRGILVKGGKYLENLAKVDVIVFDKTGTLTKSVPAVKGIIPVNGYDADEVLKIAACLEEHFPHSIANAVVNKAKDMNINHEELHGQVKYVVAHGIASEINEEKAIIGSHHFIFEDEGIELTDDIKKVIDKLPNGCSDLYLAVGGKLAGIILIEDPLKEDAAVVIKELKHIGVPKIVMLTGDNERTAKEIADTLGIDEYKSGVLPCDKSTYIENAKSEGKTVVMIGDGVNDSPALSIADIGISMNSGSDIARQVSDIQIKEDRLEDLIYMIKLSKMLNKKIKRSYSGIVTYNTGLIGAGLTNLIMPNSSAILHNIGTVIAAADCMQKYSFYTYDEYNEFDKDC